MNYGVWTIFLCVREFFSGDFKAKHFVIQNRLKPTMVGDVEYNFFEMMLITNVQTMGIRTCDPKKIETWKNLNSFWTCED